MPLMPSAPILIAHPSTAKAHARAMADQLNALGYEVEEFDASRGRVGARQVVLLWSRQAWGTPALQAVARRAHAAGSLVCIRLDAAPPPLEGARSARLAKRIPWRRLLAHHARPAAAPAPLARTYIRTARAKRAVRIPSQAGTDMRHSDSSSRSFAIVLTLFLVGAVALSAAYQRYPEVAAPINDAAAAAYTQASEIAALAP